MLIASSGDRLLTPSLFWVVLVKRRSIIRRWRDRHIQPIALTRALSARMNDLLWRAALGGTLYREQHANLFPIRARVPGACILFYTALVAASLALYEH
jgi:hypothetical protein